MSWITFHNRKNWCKGTESLWNDAGVRKLIFVISCSWSLTHHTFGQVRWDSSKPDFLYRSKVGFVFCFLLFFWKKKGTCKGIALKGGVLGKPNIFVLVLIHFYDGMVFIQTCSVFYKSLQFSLFWIHEIIWELIYFPS